MKAATQAFIEVKGLRKVLSSRALELQYAEISYNYLRLSNARLRAADSVNTSRVINLETTLDKTSRKAVTFEKLYNSCEDERKRLKRTAAGLSWTFPFALPVAIVAGFLAGFYAHK